MHLFFAAFSALLDHPLSLRVDLLVEDVPRSIALLALRGLGLDANRRSTSATDLLFGIIPGRSAVVNFVSGD